MGSLVALALGKLLTDNLLRFVATKTVLATLFIVVLPIILNNLVYDLLEYAITTSSYAPVSELPNPVVNLTGLAGWLAYNLYLPDAFSVIVSALSVRIFLDHIPFIRI